MEGRPARAVCSTGRVDEELDLGDAAQYILGERPGLADDDVWAVLNELGAPPARGGEGLALDLLKVVRPGLKPRTVKTILREWRAYANLAVQDDWEDEG